MSHVLKHNVADQIAFFRAYDSDGTAKTNLTSSTTGLAISVFRVGASSVSVSSLSDKAADDSTHSDGAIRNVGGNLYTIDLPDAATATQVPSIVVRGTYTGGVIEGLEHPIVAYDPAVNYASASKAADIETDTQDIQSRIPAALVDGRIAANAEVVGDKTGYKLASDGLVLVTDWTVDITGDLIGSIGSVSGVTFPANFGVLVIDPSGNIETVNTVLELDENALTADDAGLPIAGYVWDAQYSQHTTAGTFGKLFDIWRKSNPAIEGTVQASPSPTTTVFKTDVDYPTGAFKHSVLFFADDASIPFQNSPILTVVNNGDGTSTITIEEDTTAAPVAGDKFFIIPSNHVHAIAAIVDAVMGQATSTSNYNAGDVGYVLRQLYSMIEADGADWRYTANALEQAPAGGGGGGGTDWTSDERTAIRSILGIPASGTTPTDPSVGILDEIRDQTALIQSGGTVTVSTPVTSSGQLASPLIIGDDYLAANGRAFSWTVPLPSGFDASTAACKFGMRYEDDQGVNNFVATGTVTDAGGGNVTLAFDLARTVTGLLRPGWYDWSVEIVSASGTEITRVKSGKNAEWQEKQT